MASCKIAEGIYSVGAMNPNLRVFDIVMATNYGTTYNSYLVQGSEKTVLIESCHLTYFDRYLENIREICEISEIDAIILNHTEPDHSGCLAKLCELNPNMKVIASQAGSIYLKNITNNPNLKLQVVKDGETLDLGGKVLRFINAPFLHWPDSMFTWDESTKTLFSCDFLGSHYCEPYSFDYNISHPAKYEDAFLGYYNAIFGPFPGFVQKGLAKIDPLPIQQVCCSHGPVLTAGCRLEYAKEKYRQWSAPKVKEQTCIPIFYCTAYGNTGMVAEAIRDGIAEVKPDALVETFDLIEHDMAQMQAKLSESDAFAVGTPTINQDAVPPALQLLCGIDVIQNQKKPCLAFGSYGWSGEGVPNVVARLKSLKLKVFGDGFKVTFVPSAEDLEKAKQLGREFAESL